MKNTAANLQHPDIFEHALDRSSAKNHFHEGFLLYAVVQQVFYSTGPLFRWNGRMEERRRKGRDGKAEEYMTSLFSEQKTAQNLSICSEPIQREEHFSIYFLSSKRENTIEKSAQHQQKAFNQKLQLILVPFWFSR